METLRAKHSIERDVLSAGVGIGTYLSDNGAFTSQDFVKELMEAGQGQRLAGVGGHHQNTCCVFTMQHPLLPSANAFNLLTFWISSAQITTALQTAAIAAPYLGLCLSNITSCSLRSGDAMALLYGHANRNVIQLVRANCSANQPHRGRVTPHF